MSNGRIEIGTRVKTTLGAGTVISNEEVFGSYRNEVKLDNPENWSLHGASSTHPFFWGKDISVLA